MKTCSKCKVEKSDLDFLLRGDTGKRRTTCKVCDSAQHKVYYSENREELSAKQKVYCAENREKINAKKNKYYAENREKIAADKKVYYAENRERVLAKNKVYNRENREKLSAQKKVYYEENREQKLAQMKVYRTENREKIAAQKKFYAYGVAPAEFKGMISNQGNACAICRKNFTETGHVDHCHKTGKVRGLLCRNCNLALGYLSDSAQIAAAAAAYLTKHKKS